MGKYSEYVSQNGISAEKLTKSEHVIVVVVVVVVYFQQQHTKK